MSTRRERRARHVGWSRKVLLSMAALGVAGAMAGLATFAAFTSPTSVSHSVTSATVTIALGATGAATNRLTVNASGVLAGDTIQRAFDLTNTGNLDLATVALTTTASPSSSLDSDATNGLQMVLDRCSVAWTEAGASPAFTYTCSGALTTIIASRAVIGSNLALSLSAVMSPAGTDHCRVTLALPSGAANTFQGLTSTLTYSFTGTQRAGTNR